MLGRTTCLLLCCAIVTACGSTVKSSDEAPATNAERTVSTEIESCQPRGTGLVSVAVLPQEKSLSKASVTVIELRPGFGFVVTVANHACAPERDVQVKLAISSGAASRFAGEGQIDELVPGKRARVVIDDLGLPLLGERVLLHVEIEPVPAEVNLANNAADYPVRFSISEPKPGDG